MDKLDSVTHLVEQEGVPKMFFESDFELESEYKQIFTKEALVAPRLLQEKLTHYCDVTELHLIHQISVRRDEVVKVMVQYNELYELIEDTIPEIQLLRRRIAHIENISVAQPLNVNRLLRKKANMKLFLQQLEKLSNVRSCYMTVQNEKLNASTSFSMLDESKNALKELKGLACVDSVNEKINKLSLLTKKSLIDDFVKYSLDLAESDTSTFLNFYKMLFSRGFMVSALSNLKDSLQNHISVTMRSVLDLGVASLNISIPSNVTIDGKIKMLNHTQFIFVISQLLESLTQIIKKIALVHGLIMWECKQAKLMSNSQTTILNLELEMNKMFEALLEIIHDRCKLVFKNRTDEIKTLSHMDFVTINSLVFDFVKHSESYMGKKITPLRNILSSQSQMYLDNFDKMRLAKLTMYLESDKWKIVSLAESSQDLVDRFTKVQEKNSSLLKLEDVGYPVAQCLLEFVKVLAEYTAFFEEEHPFINRIDLVSRISNVFKTFIFQTRNLVLNAGACKTAAALKTINLSHLVCSSECLHFVLNFVPLLKKWIENEIKEPVKELSLFDISLKECKDLLNKTYEKIVIITKDVMEDASKKLVDGKWEINEDVIKEDPAGLLKSTKTIQTVMKQFLSTHPELLKTIYTKIFGLFVERFKTVVVFMKTKITTSKAKKNFAEYLRTFCDRLNESGDLVAGANIKSLEETLISEGFKN